MINPDLLGKLKSARYPFRKLDCDLYRIPKQTYREPTLSELIFECPDFKKLEKIPAIGSIHWKASSESKSATGESPEIALINLYLKQ